MFIVCVSEHLLERFMAALLLSMAAVISALIQGKNEKKRDDDLRSGGPGGLRTERRDVQ